MAMYSFVSDGAMQGVNGWKRVRACPGTSSEGKRQLNCRLIVDFEDGGLLCCPS